MELSGNETFRVERDDGTRITPVKGNQVHDYYEIYYLVSGRGRYFVNHTIYDLESGDAMLVKRGDIHQVQQLPSVSDKPERYILTFSDRFLDSLSSFVDRAAVMKCFESKKLHIPVANRHTIQTLLHKLGAEFESSDSYTREISKLHFAEIMLLLSQCADQNISPVIETLNMQEERIQEVCRYICTYYSQPISLKQIAKIAYMSPTYFSKKFKKVTGFGFNEYLTNVRVKIASNMLIETQYSITEIAFCCGYQDSNYFGDVFRKVMGMSPSAYRKQHM